MSPSAAPARRRSRSGSRRSCRRRACESGSSCAAMAATRRHWPRDVSSDSAPEEVGDEAVLLASRTGAIVVAGPDRVAAAQRAIERGAEIVLSDDGLQHYRLARDREIVVIDGRRGVGNRRLLPAGPLREPVEPARASGSARGVLARRIGAPADAGRCDDSGVRAPVRSHCARRRRDASAGGFQGQPRARGRGHRPSAAVLRSPAAARHRGCASPVAGSCSASQRGGHPLPRRPAGADDRKGCSKMLARSPISGIGPYAWMSW